MITKEKISIYEAYSGDIDGWARIGSIEEKETMKDEDWSIIDDLLQELSLLKAGDVSESYKIKITKYLQENCSNEEVIRKLEALAGRGN